MQQRWQATVVLVLLGVSALLAANVEKQARLGNDDEGYAPAPAPSASTSKDDKEADKLGDWHVRKGLYGQPSGDYSQKKGCPVSDEPADGSAYPFYLGFGSSAYQVEGAADKDGRGPSIWDTFSKWASGTKDSAHGDVAAGFYDNYKEDVKLMRSMGLRNFRFSISWSRIMYKGNGTVNEKGLKFYSNLVDELLENCIEPHITLYHWDLPYFLQTAYNGWIDYQVTDDFADYAAVVFKELGDRVKHWTTFASPYSFCMLGYGWGSHAPGRCSDCPGGGDLETEPYMCARNVVIAHAKAAKEFKKYVDVEDAKLGINLNVDWAEPWDSRNKTHWKATERHWDLAVRLFATPLYRARYPQSVRKLVPTIPQLTTREVALLKDATPDFFGLSYYTANFIKDDPYSPAPMNYTQVKKAKNGTTFGTPAASRWLVPYPMGLRKVLNWIAEEYNSPEIVIYENGVDVRGETKVDPPAVLNDEPRMQYYKEHLDAADDAVVLDDVDVTGFFGWSLLDQFEWTEGYTTRFGSVWVNFTSLERQPKNSAYWLARTFNVLPSDVEYSEVLHIPDEKEKDKGKDKGKAEYKDKDKKEDEDEDEEEAQGGFAPVTFDEFFEAMPPSILEADPATIPFNGGRRR